MPMECSLSRAFSNFDIIDLIVNASRLTGSVSPKLADFLSPSIMSPRASGNGPMLPTSASAMVASLSNFQISHCDPATKLVLKLSATKYPRYSAHQALTNGCNAIRLHM